MPSREFAWIIPFNFLSLGGHSKGEVRREKRRPPPDFFSDGARLMAILFADFIDASNQNIKSFTFWIVSGAGRSFWSVNRFSGVSGKLYKSSMLGASGLI
jgi:hypothetical protein